jgi:hypothetical protein
MDFPKTILKAVLYGTALGLMVGTSVVIGATASTIGFVGYRLLKRPK